MMARPDLVEYLTRRHWLHTSGRPNTTVEQAAFDDLPEERKRELRVEMWEACEAYWALSADEQHANAAASFALTLARNDAHFAVDIEPAICRAALAQEEGR